MTKLVSLHIENCQSWKDDTAYFGPGLNAIIGMGSRNNTGKSVIFKVLNMACKPYKYNREHRIGLIRNGEEFARATFTFDNGNSCIMVVTPSRVLFDYVFPDESYIHTENEPPNQLLEDLSVVVEEESGYIPNILNTEQSMLLVKSDRKSNYELLKIITEDADLNYMVELIRDKQIKMFSIKNKVKDRLMAFNNDLNSCKKYDIDKLNDYDENLSVFKSALSICTEVYPKVNSVLKLPEVENYWGPLSDLILALPTDKEMEILDVPWKVLSEILFPVHDQPLTKVGNIPWETLGMITGMDDIVETDKIPWELLSNLVNTDVEKIDIPWNVIKSFLEIGEEIDKIDAKRVDCPIYGKILYVNGKCIPEV